MPSRMMQNTPSGNTEGDLTVMKVISRTLSGEPPFGRTNEEENRHMHDVNDNGRREGTASSTHGTEKEQNDQVYEPQSQGPPKAVLIKIAVLSMFLLQFLFWVVACWINGKLYKQTQYAHRLKVYAVDMDGGEVGKSLLQAAQSLNGQAGQPTWVIIPYETTIDSRPPIDYNRVYDDVSVGKSIWGAVIANEGASTRLNEAINGTLKGEGEVYDPSKALTFIYNESRYHTVEKALIFPNMVKVAGIAETVHRMQFGIPRIIGGGVTPSGASAIMEPIKYTVKNIAPFAFDTTFLINTIMFVIPTISQFFLIMALNGIFGGAGAYANWSFKTNMKIRAFFAFFHPCLIGLFWASWLYIFKNGAQLGTVQFFQMWCTIWMFAMINFQVIDGVCSLIDVKWMPYMIFSWVITQIATVILPNSLASNFYRVDYFFPSYHVWGVFMTIVGHGSNNHLKINLTVLFMWLIVATCWGIFGNYTRWKRIQRGKKPAVAKYLGGR
ncbi:hypothetical protein DFH27DRAFT_556418 [Peziza echinospora]|nr:hypothetical protein DFH27DRAFT_556418 [Peziza echinospora]